MITMTIFEMKNPIKNYAWGSRTFLSDLMNQATTSEPQAELWMGVHPQGMSQVKTVSGWSSLASIISKEPEMVLGQSIAKKFDNQLPFLFKILAIDQPLSIQAHPDQNQAIEGFNQENQLNIPLTASNRNFKDASPKPELVCALTPLWVMCGFRSFKAIQENFAFLAAQSLFQQETTDNPLLSFFYHLMHQDSDQTDILIQSAVNYGKNRTEAHWHWVCKLATLFSNDIGVLAPLFLNTICLKPNESLFLSPGVLHAYLDGNAVEIMCNSDNVIRGGLTIKHIDIQALLDIVTYAPFEVNPMVATQDAQNMGWRYPASCDCFSLIRYDIKHNDKPLTISVDGPEILLCVRGTVDICYRDQKIVLHPGKSAFVSYSAKKYTITGDGMVFKGTAV